MKRSSFTLAVTLLAIAGLFSASHLFTTVHAQSGNAQVEGKGEPETIKHGKNPHAVDSYSLTTGGTAATTPITYHGGALIRTPNTYVIWYGNWNQTNGSDTPAGQQIVRDFLNNIGGSAYFQINTTYSAGSYGITGGSVNVAETTDNYSQGSRLRDSSILTIVNNAINSNKLPYDTDGVYFVLSSSDVNESSGFCTKYCGWHTAGTATKGHVRYSYVGNANRCLSSCAAQSTSPNGNAGVDGMISVIAHELEEAVTDPDPRSGWVDSGGAENADKCAWTFGHAQYQRTTNGPWANMQLGTRDFLIQRNLMHTASGDFCMVNSSQN